MQRQSPMTGSCACGTIRFAVTAPPLGTAASHCTQCRRMSGVVWSSGCVKAPDRTTHGPVKWLALSQTTKRGICPDCGAFLFWKAHDEDTISFAPGAIDGPTGLHLDKHVFTASKGDHYLIAEACRSAHRPC